MPPDPPTIGCHYGLPLTKILATPLNTTESFNHNFKCIYIAKIANVWYQVADFSC